MRLRFSKKVRESLAAEFKRVAWIGGAVFSALGWSISSGAVATAVVLWWLVAQGIAHLVLAVEDADTADTG